MTHPLHLEKNRIHDFWMEFDKLFMNRCDGLILTGDWMNSKGCLLEKEYFQKQNKPIFIYNKFILSKLSREAIRY